MSTGGLDLQRRAPDSGGIKRAADGLFGKVLHISNGLMPLSCGLLLDGTGAGFLRPKHGSLRCQFSFS